MGIMTRSAPILTINKTTRAPQQNNITTPTRSMQNKPSILHWTLYLPNPHQHSTEQSWIKTTTITKMQSTLALMLTSGHSLARVQQQHWHLQKLKIMASTIRVKKRLVLQKNLPRRRRNSVRRKPALPYKPSWSWFRFALYVRFQTPRSHLIRENVF